MFDEENTLSSESTDLENSQQSSSMELEDEVSNPHLYAINASKSWSYASASERYQSSLKGGIRQNQQDLLGRLVSREVARTFEDDVDLLTFLIMPNSPTVYMNHPCGSEILYVISDVWERIVPLVELRVDGDLVHAIIDLGQQKSIFSTKLMDYNPALQATTPVSANDCMVEVRWRQEHTMRCHRTVRVPVSLRNISEAGHLNIEVHDFLIQDSDDYYSFNLAIGCDVLSRYQLAYSNTGRVLYWIEPETHRVFTTPIVRWLQIKDRIFRTQGGRIANNISAGTLAKFYGTSDHFDRKTIPILNGAVTDRVNGVFGATMYDECDVGPEDDQWALPPCLRTNYPEDIYNDVGLMKEQISPRRVTS